MLVDKFILCVEADKDYFHF